MLKHLAGFPAGFIRLGVCVGCLLALGCKPDSAIKQGAVIDDGTKSPNPVVTGEVVNNTKANATRLGSISGVVNWQGAPPPRVRIDMSMDPACSLSSTDNYSEQYVVHSGKLANIYVYVKGVPPSQAPAGQPPVVMDQKGCRYVPHVVAVQQGGSVEFTNSDPTMHNIHTTPAAGGNASVDLSEAPMGAPQTERFRSPERMLPVRCNNHPWMNAFINVADSPYFAVTGADGRFSLKGVPPGTYTVAAVHEKLGEQDLLVTVPAKGAAKASFSFAAR